MKNRHDLKIIFFLIAVSALVYLPLIRQIGYVNDDWYLMYSVGAYGSKVFTSIFNVDRPARALVMIPAYALFGANPIYYNLSAYVFRLISALAFLWLLRMLWPRQRYTMFLASLLYLIYPGFLSQMNGIDYQSQMVSLAAAMLSVALSVKTVFVERTWQKIVLLSFSITLGWLYLGLVEYFLSFELLRISCLFLLANRLSGSMKNKLMEGFKLWAPNIFTPLIFLVWRIFFFQGERSATDVSVQFENVKLYPLQTLYHWMAQILQDLFDVTFSAWVIPLSQLTGYIQRWSGVLAVVLAGLLFYMFYSNKNDDDSVSSGLFTREALTLGLFIAIGGLLPIAMVNRDVSFPSYSRYTLVSSAGVAIFISVLLLKLRWRALRNGLITILIFISVLTHHANTVKAAGQTAATNNFWWQISWRVPQLEKNTTLIANYPGAAIEEDYFVWGPANLIYYPDKQNADDIQPGVFAVLLNKDTVEKVIAGERQAYDKRKNIITYPNYRNILVMTQPGRDSCVHVIDGTQPEYPYSERDFIREVEPYSEIEHILVDETPHTPPTVVFGPEPIHGWCYYYQKADLARQRGEWEDVQRIGEQAFGQGFEPRDLVEWMPFIQAYVSIGNVERLAELAPIINSDPYISSQACQITRSMSGLPADVVETVDSLYCLE